MSSSCGADVHSSQGWGGLKKGIYTNICSLIISSVLLQTSSRSVVWSVPTTSTNPQSLRFHKPAQPAGPSPKPGTKPRRAASTRTSGIKKPCQVWMWTKIVSFRQFSISACLCAVWERRHGSGHVCAVLVLVFGQNWIHTGSVYKWLQPLIQDWTWHIG